MASGGKKKTTMAKLDRERRMRERRIDKKARKDAKKLAAANPEVVSEDALVDEETDESVAVDDRRAALVAEA
jgi:hypothetical protein